MHVPGVETKITVEELDGIEQLLVPPVTEYVIAPPPLVEAATEGLNVPITDNVPESVGAHVTVCVIVE